MDIISRRVRFVTWKGLVFWDFEIGNKVFNGNGAYILYWSFGGTPGGMASILVPLKYM